MLLSINPSSKLHFNHPSFSVDDIFIVRKCLPKSYGKNLRENKLNEENLWRIWFVFSDTGIKREVITTLKGNNDNIYNSRVGQAGHFLLLFTANFVHIKDIIFEKHPSYLRMFETVLLSVMKQTSFRFSDKSEICFKIFRPA